MDKLPYWELEVFTFSSYTEAFFSRKKDSITNSVKAINLYENKNQNEFILYRFLVPWSYGNDRADPKHSQSRAL